MALVSALIAGLLVFLQVAPAQAYSTSNVTYNRSAAITYGDIYACNGTNCRNPAYTAFGSDCTNFASQILRAGGAPTFIETVSGSDLGWSPYNTQWNTVGSFIWEWVTNQKDATLSEISKTDAYSPAVAGDFYAYDWGKGSGMSHLSFSSGFGAFSASYAADGRGDYMDQHTTDRYHAPYNYGYRHPDSSINTATMHIYLVHMKDTLSITSGIG